MSEYNTLQTVTINLSAIHDKNNIVAQITLYSDMFKLNTFYSSAPITLPSNIIISLAQLLEEMGKQ